MNETRNYLIDMDGVLVRGKTIIPGANEFIDRLRKANAKFLILTNNSRFTARDLSYNFNMIGLDIHHESIFTSAMATARFVHSQRPEGKAFVIGESGLTTALHDLGYIITEHNPDYVILGETETLNQELFTKAIRLVAGGARFIATNPDASGPSEKGNCPGCWCFGSINRKSHRKKCLFCGETKSINDAISHQIPGSPF